MPRRRLVVLVLLAALAGPLAPGAGAADPPAAATPVPCSEAHPDDGPGGLDLALLCTLDRVRGAIVGSTDGAPAVPPSVLIGAVGALLALVVVRRVLRSGDRRTPAPEPPTEWWVCPACRSFNPPAAARCYGCGVARQPDAAVVPTASADD